MTDQADDQADDKFRWQEGDLTEQTDEEYEAERARRDAEQAAAAARQEDNDEHPG